MDGALLLQHSPEEQKSRNVGANRSCAVTTGCNRWDEGFDIVPNGDVEIARDLELLQKVADAFLAKYRSDWSFEVGDDGTFRGPALVYQLKPIQAVGFGKGHPFSVSWALTRSLSSRNIETQNQRCAEYPRVRTPQ
jgi:hypothetical protein